ncbi:MAG: hypothetical protein PHF84_08345 [bacterium]|nr:hypothetical protein [bacterium]
MEVYVNDEKLEIQLESEDNLRQVIEGINDWLFKNSKVIDKIVVDGKIYTQEIDGLSVYPVEKVNRLDLTVVNINELVHSSLNETRNYLEAILKYIQAKEEFLESDVERIILGLNWTLNILMRTNKIYNYENQFKDKEFNFREEYERFEKDKYQLEVLFTQKNNKEITRHIKDNLSQSIEKWYGYITPLMEDVSLHLSDMNSLREKVSTQIYKIISKIPEMQKLVDMIVADLQTGHDKEAMANIQIIAGTLESIIALMQLIKSTFSIDYNKLHCEGQPVEEFNRAVKDILNEMLNAIRIKDVVLMTDLLTYELNPKLEMYREILKLVSKELHIEIN